MSNRLRTLGAALAVVGLVFATAGAVAYFRVQEGYDSLQSFSEAQNVQLNYNEDGQLIDRGSTETADAIMALLVDDWNYPVVASDLDPDDPLVNTASEYMFQMAVISYHVMNGTQEVVLDAPVEYNGETFEAGTYEFKVEGRYWTDFDRMHPIEGPARGQAWTGTAHALVGELGVGTVTHSTLQMGLALAGTLGGIGLTLMLLGGGLVWATRKEDDFGFEVPDTVPESLVGEPAGV